MKLPKIDIKKILYPTDLSESSLHAFAYAASLANLSGANITMLHVLSEKPERDAIVAPYVTESQWAQIKQRNYQWAKEALIGKKRNHIAIKEVLSTFNENIKSESANHSFVTDEILVKSGDPVEQILKTADERNCDLIVIGSHGHGVIEKAFIGSTARKVVRRSKKPVLIVRLPE